MTIYDNVLRVKDKISEAAVRSGRNPDDITLVAVSKTVGHQEVKEAIRAGVTHFAENRVQMLLDKQKDPDLIYPKVDWHLIGHLQTNKVKYLKDRVSLIHSVDSIKLVEEINKQAEKNGKKTDILLELNISGEESKFGLSPEEIPVFMEKFSEFNHVNLKGLMTMAPKIAEEKEKRKIFCKLNEIFVDMNSNKIYNIHMSIMSMGMSNDFEVAVEEGSNLVRIGTSIFYTG
ncbi:MAG: YggS family pyridoxal phosphate-dependent enzyme [Ruminococcaceae bacterium]|nr:YggS family pyridoxal phosphate-dependent enzyme [Oscillospiraceae bacterium]